MDTSAGTLVGNPEKAVSGVYWLFAKDAFGCYSSGQKVTLICDTAESCSAPQSLKVDEVAGNILVTFQGAAYPPPGNSYTVKRRLASDPDLDGSYTTIGTPIYNAGLNVWQIIDPSAANNTKYVYKAQSNCGGSPGTTPYTTYSFSNVTCVNDFNVTPQLTSLDYSFTPNGGDVTKYEVKIYDSTGTVLIKTDTFTPSFSDPITGSFQYLEMGTDYVIDVIVYVDDDTAICHEGTFTTAVG